MVGPKPTGRAKAHRIERLRQVVWAGLISLVLAFLTVLSPVDIFLWIAQSRIASVEASGEIVYLTSGQDLADPAFPERRRHLAQLVDRLDDAGVSAVYVDAVFDQPTDTATDSNLNAALRDFGGRAFLTQSVRTGIDGEPIRVRSTVQVREGVQQVGGYLYKDFTGYAWNAFYVVDHGDGELPNLSAQIAGIEGAPDERFPINYNFDLETIPLLTLSNGLAQDADLSTLAGRSVVIGSENRIDGSTFNVPGLPEVSPTLVHVLAAETLLKGRTVLISGWFSALIAIATLAGAAMIRARRRRRGIYLAIVLAIPIALLATAQLGWRVEFSPMLGVVGIYGIFRLRAIWKDSFALIDPETSLPSFAALEASKDVADTVPAIIVAKIQRFEQVRRTLPKELHAEYILRIIARLKAATQDATIYIGQGHMIAWTVPEKDPALLREHLEGLRALFGSPLIVGESQVDVGITFGVDITPSPKVTRRLASAVDAAERTNETYDPIAIADSSSDEDLIWNISLQARIDTALSNGEIYLVYQPKVMVQTGEIIGVEALVRWKDPMKGHIPPDNFIRQCETVGRMSHLTRFVLEEACNAGNAFDEHGLGIPVSVNISATLVHERGIVTMVAEVLKKTGFDPRRLTLEITETFRISSIDSAAEVLGELKALGIKISMDDFGVGAASLEALLRLPFGELKIDRLFISRITTDPKALGIVCNVLRLGKDLRIIVVAEGVEDAGTLNLLRESGCLVAQGYAISRPVEFDRIVAFQTARKILPIENMV
ncbi:MAG: EAL domain-containing protein [Erythrobacter sp.]|nr:MAG: EAL domain-containing protein [Erythrobacter sp.]